MTLWITTTSEQRPIFSGPKGSRYTQVWLCIAIAFQKNFSSLTSMTNCKHLWNRNVQTLNISIQTKKVHIGWKILKYLFIKTSYYRVSKLQMWRKPNKVKLSNSCFSRSYSIFVCWGNKKIHLKRKVTLALMSIFLMRNLISVNFWSSN